MRVNAQTCRAEELRQARWARIEQARRQAAARIPDWVACPVVLSPGVWDRGIYGFFFDELTDWSIPEDMLDNMAGQLRQRIDRDILVAIGSGEIGTISGFSWYETVKIK